MSKKKKIAITGLIGSGKSSVLKHLSDLGYKVFSADEFVADLYKSNVQLAKQIQDLTPVSVLTDGLIDKKKLKEVFFKDKRLKSEVERIVHDLVYKAILDDKIEAQFYEVPLLFENQKNSLFDEIILVIASRENQFKRLQENRKMTDEQIQERLDNQMDVKYKIAHSDVLFINDTTIEHLNYQIDQYLQRRKHDIK